VNLRFDQNGNLVEELPSNSREALPQELLASLNPEHLDAGGTLFGIGMTREVAGSRRAGELAR
jgi:hypothetical protein